MSKYNPNNPQFGQSKPHYRFSLRYDENTFYKLNMGNVVKTASPYYLVYSPSGWWNTEITDTRNLKYWGIFREHTTPYKFVKDGRRILRKLLYDPTFEGYETPCLLWVEMLNTKTQEYEYMTSADINWKKSSDSRDYFAVELKSRGIEGMIKENEDTEYEFPMNTPDVVTINNPAQLVPGIARFLTYWPIGGTNPDSTASESTNRQTYKLYCVHTSEELFPVTGVTGDNMPVSFPNSLVVFSGTSPTNQVDGQLFETGPTAGMSGSGWGRGHKYNFLLLANVALTKVRITGAVSFYIKNNTGVDNYYRLSFGLIDASLNQVSTPYVVSQLVPNGGTGLNFTLSLNSSEFDIPAGHRLIMYGTMEHNTSTMDSDHDFRWERENKIRFDFYHYTNSFSYKVRPLKYLLKDLILKCTQDYRYQIVFNMKLFNSRDFHAFIDTIPDSCYVTCGDAIRNVNTSGYSAPAIKTSLSSAFKFLDVCFDGAMGVKGSTVTFARKREMYDMNNILFDVGEIGSDWSLKPFEGAFFKTIYVGFKDQNINETYGREEVNSTQHWETPMTGNKTALDLTTDYRADPIGIFWTWANYNLLNNKDSQGDNDVFVVDTVFNGVNYVPRTWSGIIFGVTNTSTLMNIAYSPNHCLRRNLWRIKMGLRNNPAKKFKLTKAFKNRELYTDLGYGIVDQDADIPMWEGDAPTLLPQVFEFAVPSPKNYLPLMRIHPEWQITGTCNGVRFYGFPDETGTIPHPKKAYRFRLHLNTNTSITSLMQLQNSRND